MNFNLDNTVDYHYDKFPPGNIDYEKFVGPLLRATDAVARYDQMYCLQSGVLMHWILYLQIQFLEIINLHQKVAYLLLVLQDLQENF